MNKCSWWCCLAINLVWLSYPCHAQDKSELDRLYDELDSLFADETIPADLFRLADSVLALESARISAISLRVGYVSEIVSAGRAFGIDQFGFNPALYYYHHSGFYGGATGYWSNEFEPGYYLTDISVGYMKTFRNKWHVLADHSFYVYNDTLGDHPFKRNIQGGVSRQFKFADAGVDYSFLYGNNTAHRITAQANFRFKKRFKGWIEAITFMPGAAGQWGNADVFYWRQPRTALTDLYHIVRSNEYPRLSFREYLRLYNMLENNREVAAALFLSRREYTLEQIETLIDQYNDGHVLSEDTFGFINFSISMPVIIRAGKFSLLLNYTYNLPQRLPGETFTYDPSGYFSTSLSWSLSWLKK